MFLLFSFNAQTPPLNIQQISHVPTTSFIVPSELNDIWGWVDNQGKEYAIIGTNDGTSIKTITVFFLMTSFSAKSLNQLSSKLKILKIIFILPVKLVVENPLYSLTFAPSPKKIQPS